MVEVETKTLSAAKNQEDSASHTESDTEGLEMSDRLAEDDGCKNHSSDWEESRHDRGVDRRRERNPADKEILIASHAEEASPNETTEVLAGNLLGWREERENPEADSRAKDTQSREEDRTDVVVVEIGQGILGDGGHKPPEDVTGEHCSMTGESLKSLWFHRKKKRIIPSHG
jgi:hypothetical protein